MSVVNPSVKTKMKEFGLLTFSACSMAGIEFSGQLFPPPTSTTFMSSVNLSAVGSINGGPKPENNNMQWLYSQVPSIRF